MGHTTYQAQVQIEDIRACLRLSMKDPCIITCSESHVTRNDNKYTRAVACFLAKLDLIVHWQLDDINVFCVEHLFRIWD